MECLQAIIMIPTCHHAEAPVLQTPRSVLAFVPDAAFLLLSLRSWSVLEVRLHVCCFIVSLFYAVN